MQWETLNYYTIDDHLFGQCINAVLWITNEVSNQRLVTTHIIIRNVVNLCEELNMTQSTSLSKFVRNWLKDGVTLISYRWGTLSIRPPLIHFIHLKENLFLSEAFA